MAAQQRLFGVRGGHAQTLRRIEVDALQALLERCAGFFQLVWGAPPSAGAAQTLVTQLPEGKEPWDTQVIGLCGADGHLVGVLDAVRDPPDPGTWWLGLLLLEPRVRVPGGPQERNRGRGEEW